MDYALDLLAPPAPLNLLHQVAVSAHAVAALALIVVSALRAVVAHANYRRHSAGVAAIVVVDDRHGVELLDDFGLDESLRLQRAAVGLAGETGD